MTREQLEAEFKILKGQVEGYAIQSREDQKTMLSMAIALNHIKRLPLHIGDESKRNAAVVQEARNIAGSAVSKYAGLLNKLGS